MKAKPLSYWLELLDHPDPSARAEAADELRKYETDDIVKRLSELLADSDREVREVAIDSLGRIGFRNPTAIEVLVAALLSESQHIRDRAADRLSEILPDPASTLPLLLVPLGEADPSFHETIGRIVDELEHTEMVVLPEIEKFLKSGRKNERLGAIRAIVFIKAYSEWRLGLLNDISEDPDADIREAVELAVRAIREQPWYDGYEEGKWPE